MNTQDILQRDKRRMDANPAAVRADLQKADLRPGRPMQGANLRGHWYTSIEVYWDNQDPHHEGWAYRAGDSDRHDVVSGAIDGVDAHDLDGAIAAACRILEISLRPDQFACDPRRDGGSALWIRP